MAQERRIGLFASSSSGHLRQQPFVVWDNRTGCWRIWLSFDPTVKSGTYLELSTGTVDRVTVLNEEVMEIVRL